MLKPVVAVVVMMPVSVKEKHPSTDVAFGEIAAAAAVATAREVNEPCW